MWISEPWLGELQDTGIATRPVGEAGSHPLEQHADRLLVAEQLQDMAASGNIRRASGGPFLPLGTLAPSFPLGGVRFRRGSHRFSALRIGQTAAGDRNALFHQRPHFLGLRLGGDHSPRNLGRILFQLGIPLRENQSACQILEHGPAVARGTPENSTSSTMTHLYNPS